VKVYVKVLRNSPFLICMDVAHSREDLIDPEYSWTGPDGSSLAGQKYAKLTAMGALMVVDFKESMSGAYTCTFSHRILETTTMQETEVVETYKFMVYAYREADHTYQVFARFTTQKCKLEANGHFFGELRTTLNNVISDLTCHIVESSYKCHRIQTPAQGLLHELFVNFQVSPYGAGWEEACPQTPHDCEDVTNARAQEAGVRIGRFFSEQAYAPKLKLQTSPATRLVENSFSLTRIDNCRPGFGRNNVTHKTCASCCVVCEPGTYSPNDDVTCQICARPGVKEYGARSC
ncbi:ZPBP2 protein, partial [Todus mexicanus]|nr:ZPBP2 protein [Todus mexicanus]